MFTVLHEDIYSNDKEHDGGVNVAHPSDDLMHVFRLHIYDDDSMGSDLQGGTLRSCTDRACYNFCDTLIERPWNDVVAGKFF